MRLGAVVLRGRGVLLGFVVPAVPVIVFCLPMVMGGSLVMPRRSMMMFGSRRSCGRGHARPPHQMPCCRNGLFSHTSNAQA
jgi:hypothetical protein